MTEKDTKKWFDLVALIAVIGGLVLVAYEIRQANIFAKAATENSIYEGWETLSMWQIELGINALRVKAIEDPESMTASELADLGNWLVSIISIYQRNGIMFYKYGLASDPAYSQVGSFYFISQVERDWFERNESWIRRETPTLADEIRHYIETTPVDPSFFGLIDYKSQPTN